MYNQTLKGNKRPAIRGLFYLYLMLYILLHYSRFGHNPTDDLFFWLGILLIIGIYYAIKATASRVNWLKNNPHVIWIVIGIASLLIIMYAVFKVNSN